MKKKTLILLAFIVPTCLLAQQDPMVSQYMFNINLMNPAYAGCHPYPNATVIYRKQWLGFSGAPTSQFASFDAPIGGKNIGLGLQFTRDVVGITERTDINGDYSYHLKLDNAKLAMGLRTGLSYYRAELSELKVWDEGDDVYRQSTVTAIVPNFGTGLYYYTDKYFAGLAIPHIINYEPGTTLNIKTAKAPHQVRHYYITGGYVYSVNENVILKPSFLLKYVPNTPAEVDINLNVLLKQVIWLGVSYRSGDSFVGLVEFQINKQLRLGYAHDFTISCLRHYNSGSHEIIVSYDLGKEAVKMKTPRFF
ncbi:MAG: type IX secretion system membrane protein PorP/SprF [Bacteroidota bacterium]